MNDRIRIHTYTLVVALIVPILGVAAFANWQTRYIVSIIQSILALCYLLSLFFVIRGRYIEFCGHILMYSISASQFYNITQLGGVDPMPYGGLMAALIVAYFLLTSRYGFICYAVVMNVIFVALFASGHVPISAHIASKFIVLNGLLSVLIMMCRHDDRIELKKAEETRDKLAVQNVELAHAKVVAEEAKAEVEKVNKFMIGRELKMAELKKEMQQCQVHDHAATTS